MMDLIGIESIESFKYNEELRELKRLSFAKRNLTTRRDELKKIIDEISSQLEGIAESQLQPFRREATTKEKEITHSLKTKISQNKRLIEEYENKLSVILSSIARADKAQLQLAKRVAVARENTKRSNEKSFERSLPPMIVGRNLGCVIDPFFASPELTYNAVRELSELTIVQGRVQNALQLVPESKALFRMSKDIKYTKELEKEALNRLNWKIIKLEDKRRRQSADIRRLNLMSAIVKFWDSNFSLPFRATDDVGSKLCHDETIATQFVRKLRADERIGEMRRIHLLSELSKAKRSNKDSWDSCILLGTSSTRDFNARTHFSGYNSNLHTRSAETTKTGSTTFYRYHRVTFIKILEDELDRLKEIIPLEDIETATSYKSRHNYERRKRQLYNHTIEEAKTLVGKTVQIIGSRSRTLCVASCTINWIENGTKPEIEHELYEKGNSLGNGKSIKVNLLQCRYFELKRHTKLQQICENIPVLDLRQIHSYHVSFMFRDALMRELLIYFLFCYQFKYEQNERYDVEDSLVFFYDKHQQSSIFVLNKIHREIERSKRKMQLNFCSCLELRQHDERRKVSYRDSLNHYSRFQCIQKRTNDIVQEKMHLVEKLDVFKRCVNLSERELDKANITSVIIGSELQFLTQRLQDLAFCKNSLLHCIDELQKCKEIRESTFKRKDDAEFATQEARCVVESWNLSREEVYQLLSIELSKLTLLEKRDHLIRERLEVAQCNFFHSNIRVRSESLKTRYAIAHTVFGLGRVNCFREKDGVLCVQLLIPFRVHTEKTEMKLRVYTSIQKCLKLEDSKINNAKIDMEAADKWNRAYDQSERNKTILETYMMNSEEKRTQLFLRVDRENAEKNKRISLTQDLVLRDFNIFIKSTEGKLEIEEEVRTRLEAEESRRMTIARRWDGTGPRPTPLTSMERISLQKSLTQQVKQDRFHRSVNEAHATMNQKFCEERLNGIYDSIFHYLLHHQLKSVVSKSVEVEKSWEQQCCNDIERDEGVFIDFEQSMSPKVLKSLIYSRKQRQGDLSFIIKNSTQIEGLEQKTFSCLRVEQNEHDYIDLDEWKLHQGETRRQTRMCHEMDSVDNYQKSFYREEFKHQFESMKSMQFEDKYCKQYFEELSKSTNTQRQLYVTRHHERQCGKRSLLLKKDAAERKRQKREFARMKIDDFWSAALRNTIKTNLFMDMLQMEAGFDLKNCSLCLIPERVQDVKVASVACQLELMKLEQMLTAIKKLSSRSRSKIKELVHRLEKFNAGTKMATTNARDLERESLLISSSYIDASRKFTELEDITEQERIRMTFLERSTKWTDSKVLTNFNQRWLTTKLEAHLKVPYFKSIVIYIICNALLNSNKRALSLLLDQMQMVDIDFKRKRLQMKKITQKYKRNTEMNRRRSSMNMFRKLRLSVLSGAIKAWREYTVWKIRKKSEYQLRYKMVLCSSLVKNKNSKSILYSQT